MENTRCRKFPSALKVAEALLVLSAFLFPFPSLAEFTYWNLNGERRLLQEGFSFSEMAREINALRKATQEISVSDSAPEKPNQDWKRGQMVFDMFFSHFGPEANAALLLAELDGFDGEINPSELKEQSKRWRQRLRKATREKAEMRSLLELLPAEKRAQRKEVKASLSQIRDEIERCNKVLNGIDKLEVLHNLFTNNILRYHHYLIEDLAYELRSKTPVQISEKAERAIDRWFIADGDLAASFLKRLGDTSLSEVRPSGAAARMEQLAASRLSAARRSCHVFSQLTPRPH